ncbi:MAG TPA: restriction endonuclease subunit S [Verrucomicrobiae bacterium]|nr:restriction endonuclease subunit S [Verrucomicrobiae bacterium]
MNFPTERGSATRRSDELPQGCAWTDVGTLTEVVRGGSPRPKGDPRYFGGSIPWIMISDVTRQRGKYLSVTREFVTPEGAERSRLLPAGSLILSNSGTICVPKILAVDGCIHDGFLAFPDLAKLVSLDFAYWWFERVRPQIINENRQGNTQVNLNTGIARGIRFPLAPLAEQRRIVAKLETLFYKVDACQQLPPLAAQQEIVRRAEALFTLADQIEARFQKARAQVDKLTPSLLAKAFRGQLVPQDPNDEPAEKLLERIKPNHETKSDKDARK